MDTVNNCRECGNAHYCFEKLKDGIVVYCGSSMCKPEKE